MAAKKRGGAKRRSAADVLADLVAADQAGTGTAETETPGAWDGDGDLDGLADDGAGAETPAERRRRYLEDAGAGAEWEGRLTVSSETVRGQTVLARTIDAAARLARTAKSEAVRLRALQVCYDLQTEHQRIQAQTDVGDELRAFLARISAQKPLIGAPGDAARQGGSKP